MRPVEIHSTEDDMIIGAIALADLPAGTCINYLGQIAFLSQPCKAGSQVVALKSGLISVSASIALIFPGYVGVIYGQDRPGSFGNFTVLDIGIYDGDPIGIVQHWDISNPRDMRFFMSIGFSSNTGIDALARSMAEDAQETADIAYALAQQALTRFPVDSYFMINNAQLIPGNGGESLVDFDVHNRGNVGDVRYDPADNTKIIFGTSGLYLVSASIRPTDYTEARAALSNFTLQLANNPGNGFEGRVYRQRMMSIPQTWLVRGGFGPLQIIMRNENPTQQQYDCSFTAFRIAN